MSTEFKDVKQAIVEAQLSSTPKNKLIDEILRGSTELLSANDIVKRLGITADEFGRLVNLPNHHLQTTGPLGAGVARAFRMFDETVELVNSELNKKIAFPKPDLYILGKARWTKETFKKWLEEQIK